MYNLSEPTSLRLLKEIIEDRKYTAKLINGLDNTIEDIEVNVEITNNLLLKITYEKI